MPKTQTFEIEDAEPITLQRLSFRQMRELGPVIEGFYEMETPGEVLYSDGFEKLMRAAAVDDDDFERLMDADLHAVWKIWEAYAEFARFDAFLAEAAASQQKRVAGYQEAQLKQAKDRVEMMKKAGLVPKDFSLDDELARAASRRGSEVVPAPSQGGSEKPAEKAGRKTST